MNPRTLFLAFAGAVLAAVVLWLVFFRDGSAKSADDAPAQQASPKETAEPKRDVQADPDTEARARRRARRKGVTGEIKVNDHRTGHAKSKLEPRPNQGPRPITAKNTRVLNQAARALVFGCAKKHGLEVPRKTRVSVLVDLSAQGGAMSAGVAQAEVPGYPNAAYEDCVVEGLGGRTLVADDSGQEDFDFYQMGLSFELR